jgi:hypothetical protein
MLYSWGSCQVRRTGRPEVSLLIAVCGRRKVIVCGDSRAVYLDGRHRDDIQKLFQAGRYTVCGISGATHLGAAGSVPDRVSKLCAKEELRDNPVQLLDAIRADVHALLSEIPLPPEDPIVFAAFVLRKQQNGNLDLLELEFPIATTAKGRRTIDQPCVTVHAEGPALGRIAYSLGHGDCLTRKLEQRLDPDVLSDDAIVNGVEEIFEAAKAENRKCQADIGGRIKVAVIDAGGFRWLPNKTARTG